MNADERLFEDKFYPKADTDHNLNRYRDGDATRNVERKECVRTCVLDYVETLRSNSWIE